MVTKSELLKLKKEFFGKRALTPHERVAPAIMRASKLIEKCGWVRGALCTEDGYCIVGAILASEEDVEVQELAFGFVRDACGHRAVSKWNDTIAATKKDVLRAMKIAAEAARLMFMAKEPAMAGRDRSSIYSFA